MKKFILITAEKIKYLINEKEKEAVLEAITEGEKMVIVQGEIVPLQIIPTITKLERWYAQEVERLSLKGRNLCRFCLKTKFLGERCGCREFQKNVAEDNAFLATSQEVKHIAEKFSWPKDQKQLKAPGLIDDNL